MDSYINKLKKDDKDRRKVPKHNPQKVIYLITEWLPVTCTVTVLLL